MCLQETKIQEMTIGIVWSLGGGRCLELGGGGGGFGTIGVIVGGVGGGDLFSLLSFQEL